MNLSALMLAYSSGHAGKCIILYSFHDNKYFFKSETVKSQVQSEFFDPKKLIVIKITFCSYVKHDLLVCSDWMFVGVAKL